MTRQADEPKPLAFDTAPERTPGRLAFDVRANPRAGDRPAPKALDFGPEPARASREAGPTIASAARVADAAQRPLGKAVFEEASHAVLDECFQAAQDAFPNLYPHCGPRVERCIRQLVPLRIATVATMGDKALETSGALVESVAMLVREFNELGAADAMAGLLAQATHKAGMLARWLKPSVAGVDYRGTLGALKASLAFFPRRSAALVDDVARAEESLVIVLAALSAVAKTIGIPDDAGLARTLDDRCAIVGQALAQIRMQPAQLRGLDERVLELLSRADHLMNVVLPAAAAARPR
jgi:hypothetical protein